MACFGSMKEDWGIKSDPSRKSWKKRYFILQDNAFHYFVNPKKLKSKGSILFKDIRDVRASDYTKKPFCFEIETDNRNYLISTTTEDLKQSWINSIRVLAKIHNRRNEWEGKQGFSDQYKHKIITSAKKALNYTTKLTGISKALVPKDGSNFEIYDDNSTLGKAAVDASFSILDSLNNVYNDQKIESMCELCVLWKSLSRTIVKYAEGTPNKAAIEFAISTLNSALDEILNCERPSPVVELGSCLESYVYSFLLYLGSGEVEKNHRTREFREAGAQIISSTKYVESAVPDDMRNDVRVTSDNLRKSTDKLRDAMKNATHFSDATSLEEAEQSKKILMRNLLEFIEIYEYIFQCSIRKKLVVQLVGPSNQTESSLELETTNFGIDFGHIINTHINQQPKPVEEIYHVQGDKIEAPFDDEQTVGEPIPIKPIVDPFAGVGQFGNSPMSPTLHQGINISGSPMPIVDDPFSELDQFL
eukprot:TRINITY_DN3884_c0_g1_i2.p1 TRINITY_DN3884_c0_g1~~TRINITY_DN3884_c0_g1_i2.p1  ORF type:complete len:474 (+),score=115.21 TRINITY_DN3884_c0_g1_i2:68-1489(+)